MPVAPTFPGVYIDELPSAVRTIIGVSTSVTGFVGPAARGPVNEARHLTSWGDFERIFGGLSAGSPMSYAVYQFYQNGGAEAEVVRVMSGGKNSTLDVHPGHVTLEAQYPGSWGDALRARIDYETSDTNDTDLYNLTIRDTTTGAEERYLDVNIAADHPRSLSELTRSSRLAKVTADDHSRPPQSAKILSGDPFADDPDKDPQDQAGAYVQASGGDDGTVDEGAFNGSVAAKTGMYALLRTDIFNLLVISPPSLDGAVGDGVLTNALNLCVDRRAMLLLDSPKAWTDVDTAFAGIASVVPTGDAAKNAAMYFPRICLRDPVRNEVRAFGPAAAVAAVMARTDVQRGVWKAPAGMDASIAEVLATTVPMTDLENGRLNPRGLNCIRTFPLAGTVVWGARTRRGADLFGDQWKYVPVRRTALFIEESLYRGTKWAVFEPNDEPLWASLRLNIGAFMNSLFRQGAFQGRTAREAYLVKCDAENNPQNDIDRGIVNILVGFAPLKPAEFVIIHIQQLAGQLET